MKTSAIFERKLALRHDLFDYFTFENFVCLRAFFCARKLQFEKK